MNFQIESLDDLVEIIEYSHIVIYITQCNEMIKNDGEEFANIIERLLDSTEYLKVIIVHDDGYKMVCSDHYSDEIILQPFQP